MSLWDRLMGEFIDVIEWTSDDGRTMVWRFERQGNSIKYGAKLTVREGQAAVFFNEGRIADVFGPGMYMLETNNLPVLSSLQHWDHGFESPFKAEVYFVSLKRFVNLKWGTKNPIMLRDAEFGPVRLRAFGTYAVRVDDPAKFMVELVGTESHFEVGEIADNLRDVIISRFANALAESNIPALDLSRHYDKIGEALRQRIDPEMREAYGLELSQLLIENVSFPPEVEKALDRRTEIGVIGDLDRYKHYEAARSLGAAAENSGAAGAGMGVMVGGTLGQGLGGVLNTPAPPASAGAASPPPLPGAGAAKPQGKLWHVALDGAPAGPYDEDSVRKSIAAGGLPAEALVWSQGMSAWRPAREALNLGGSEAPSAPPPLPKG